MHALHCTEVRGRQEMTTSRQETAACSLQASGRTLADADDLVDPLHGGCSTLLGCAFLRGRQLQCPAAAELLQVVVASCLQHVWRETASTCLAFICTWAMSAMVGSDSHTLDLVCLQSTSMIRRVEAVMQAWHTCSSDSSPSTTKLWMPCRPNAALAAVWDLMASA